MYWLVAMVAIAPNARGVTNYKFNRFFFNLVFSQTTYLAKFLKMTVPQVGSDNAKCTCERKFSTLLHLKINIIILAVKHDFID
jgi:hypothetical protein